MIAAIRSDEDFESRVEGFGRNTRLAFIEAFMIEKLAERGDLKETLDRFGERSPGRVMTGSGWARVMLAELDDRAEITVQVCPGWAFVSVGREFNCDNIRLSARAEKQLQEHFGIEPDPEACRA